MNNWISVEDRLPKPFHASGIARNYLTFTPFYDQEKSSLMQYNIQLSPFIKQYPHGSSDEEYATGFGFNDGVTHWQPLPEPPE